MKKFLIVLLVLGGLIGGGIFAVTQLVSVEKLTAQAKTVFHEKTGRDLAWGAERFSFFPNIGFRLNDVTVSNASWAKAPQLLELGEVELRLAVQPLLRKQVEVKKFILKAPVVNLEKDADGKGNWDLATQKKTEPEKGADTKETDAMAVPQDIGFKFGSFDVSNGKLFYADGATGDDYALDNIDVSIVYPDLQSAFQMDGAVTFRDKRVNFVLYLEKPMDFIKGKVSPGNIQIKTDVMEASLEGALSLKGDFFTGKANASIASLSDLLVWATGNAQKDLPFTKISFDAETTLSSKQIALQGAVLKLDDIEAGGTASVSLEGVRPFIEARLGVSHLDLDRFIGGADKTAQNAKDGAGKKSAAQQDWDETPMDFSSLRSMDADLILQTKGFSLKGADVGPSGLKVVLRDGNLKFTSTEATLFGGKVMSEFTLNAASAATPLSFRFNMSGVQARPVLETFADFKKLSGTMDAEVAVMATGNSQKAIVNSLTGDGKVMFRNGALEGIDLVNIAKMVQQHLSNIGVGEGKTDFVELGGTFVVVNGVATNQDLRMKGPLVQASGAGSIDLPKKRLDYRVTPILTASSAVEGAKGIGIPVDIKGPFNNIKVKPDYASVVRDVIENPENAKETLKNVKEQGKQLKGNLKEFRKELKADPDAALQNLLGGGLFGGAPAPQPAPSVEPVPAQ